ncbi:MAG: ABC transporter ATP-binding protein [Roseitalea sp.]|jgi:peptide/nickel transport system ATP-binding protein|nr:ABC transporter ATP-binding protein [Roseitalea sp.]MBO6720588.1 ABC transporter ATP-binding protein [Roseitalea sp.]MBO6743735.1 ABC transporter ATP-binding protein [Roseitalea sp.]
MTPNAALANGDKAPVLSVNGLNVDARLATGDVSVLCDISIDVAKGEILGVIGESGSGLTVLSRAIMNWLPSPLQATKGEVNFRGSNLLKVSAAEMRRLRGKEIAYIGSDSSTALNPTVPIGKHLVSKLRSVLPQYSEQQARQRIMELFDAVRIPSPRARFNEFPFQFSGGMMQRVMIVDALCTDPALLVADNITQPLDVTVAEQIVRLLRDLRDDFGTSVVFSSASLPVAAEISERLLVLQNGRVLEETTPQDIVSSPKTDYTKTLTARVPRIWSVDHTPPRSVVMKPILSVRNATKAYFTKDPKTYFGKQTVEAVRGVSFDVLEGENLGIVGESGCGKSTLSRLLSWVEQPDTGDIFFDGKSISKMSNRELKALRSQFQLILQDPYTCLPGHKTVGEIISEPLRIHRIGSVSKQRDRVREVMQEVGLPAGSDLNLPYQLSASQRQRVNIARAMVLNPRLLILDETLSSLDQVEQARLLDLFEDLQKRHKYTYIFISHDLALVRRACSRVLVMYLGRVVEMAENEKLFFDPQHPYSRALLSAMPTLEKNRFDAEECLLEGEPPSPVNIQPGCSFRTRCPHAMEICGKIDPTPETHGLSHVECHLVHEREMVQELDRQSMRRHDP